MPRNGAALQANPTLLTPSPAIPEEQEVVDWLQADTTTAGILPGGIFAYSALPRTGIKRDTFAQCFDAGGLLLPLCVVKARAPIPDPSLFDEEERVVAQTQVLECWLYQWVGYDQIRAAQQAIYARMQGHAFPATWKAQWAYTSPQLADQGALLGASCQRMDWRIRRLNHAS